MSEPHRLQSPFWRRALLWGSRRLPPPAKLLTMPLWALIPFVAVPAARRQIARNLERILGPAPKVVGAARAYRLLLTFAQSLANSYAAHGGRGVEVEAEIAGGERLDAARAASRGVVVATGHIGPWQLGPYLLERAGVGPLVVAMAREQDAATQALEHELRSRFRVVYTDEPFAALELLRVLRSGGLVAVQMDRPPPGSNGTSRVPFAGGEAPFPSGPAALARAAESPIVPVFLIATAPFRVRVDVGEPISVARTEDRHGDVTAATRALARAYEDCVRAHPYQWYAFHDFWA